MAFPEIPVRTELTVLDGDPEARKFGFSIYEYLGSEVYVVPEGQEITEALLSDENIVTSEDGLKEGMRLLCPTLFGYGLGIVSFDDKGCPRCLSESGDTSYFLVFTNDRPPNEDGTPASPRWVGCGSANMRSKKFSETSWFMSAVIIGTIAGGGGMIQGGEVTSAVPTMPEREGQPIRQVPVTPPPKNGRLKDPKARVEMTQRTGTRSSSGKVPG